MRHPLHPALVHFPIACWSLASAADLASLFLGQPAWWLAGVLMTIGLTLAIPAMIAGFTELMRLPEDNPAIRDVNRHMIMVMAAFSLYLASLLMRVEGMTLHAPGLLAMALSLAGFVCLGIAGWLGGKLVYGHRLGAD
ncbi:MAG TPA: DUF2231 domain-containing protein [Dokdonella sp.]|uniref:DUF2231 domain-containing protein n=1 Tax=Dokdonella sp. TaxID=2291710 RepID=UPI002D806524|nr:DUF2231 domain-containing protein [Dokdonella sp.]HET9032897.1 DUF2231 domain-containing protein [Dokdonella sp.]